MATCDLPAPKAAHPSTAALQQLKKLLQRELVIAKALGAIAACW